MPTNPYMYAGDLVDVLKKKHASGTYKSMVNYLLLSSSCRFCDVMFIDNVVNV